VVADTAHLSQFLCSASCCTVLRSGWCQSGVNSGNSGFTIVLAIIYDMINYLTWPLG
jgi:hypothetical protein